MWAKMQMSLVPGPLGLYLTPLEEENTSLGIFYEAPA